MREAGVDLVTLGVFSWALLEPGPGQYDFGWLDERHGRPRTRAGIKVDLATATASPPPWLTHRHPEMLPVTQDGRTLWPGGRQAFCPSSPVYREHALRPVHARWPSATATTPRWRCGTSATSSAATTRAATAT